MIKIGLIEDESLEFLTKKVKKLEKQLEQANERIKELEKIKLSKISDEYKEIDKKYSSQILKVLELKEEYIKTLNDITSSKEYIHNKLCDKCDFNNYDYDVEEITKKYCPFAPICSIDIGEDFDTKTIIKILLEEKK